MAPESVKKMEYTRFSDIWAIGCLTIEMVTGEPPWSEYKNPMAILFQLYNSNKPPPIPDCVSRLCKSFIESCLQLNPNHRSNVRQLLKHPFITEIETFDQLKMKVTIDKKNTIQLTHMTNSGGSSDSNKSRQKSNFFTSKTEDLSRVHS